MTSATDLSPREVPIDWEALEDAFENNAPEVRSYLNLTTGETLRVVAGIADPDMHARISASSDYLRIDPVNSREQYRWMERFVPMVDDEELAGRLEDAIDGKGAFRRFKDALVSHAPERERWFAFRSERLRVFMEAWLSAHGIAPVARAAPRSEIRELRPITDEPPISQADLSPRSIRRTPDDARLALARTVELLSARDLEKVLAFAEFVRARAVVR